MSPLERSGPPESQAILSSTLDGKTTVRDYISTVLGYHSPELHRFISEDPLHPRAGTPNFYVYVDNNTLRFNDPLGLDKDDASARNNPSNAVTDTPDYY